MAFFHFSISNNKIKSSNGNLVSIDNDYKKYEEKSFGLCNLYYRVKNDRLTDIIAESDIGGAYVQKEVEEFLENIK